MLTTRKRDTTPPGWESFGELQPDSQVFLMVRQAQACKKGAPHRDTGPGLRATRPNRHESGQGAQAPAPGALSMADALGQGGTPECVDR